MHRYIYIQDDQCKRRNGAPSSVCSQLHKTTSRGQIPPSPLAITLDHPPTDRGQTRRRNRVACASSIDIIYQRLPKSFKNSNADASLKIICVYSEWCSTYMFWACIRTYVVAREAWSTVISPKKKVYGNFGYWVRKFSNRELKRLRSKVKIIGCSPVRGLETGKLQHTYAINRVLIFRCERTRRRLSFCRFFLRKSGSFFIRLSFCQWVRYRLAFFSSGLNGDGTGTKCTHQRCPSRQFSSELRMQITLSQHSCFGVLNANTCMIYTCVFTVFKHDEWLPKK